MIKDFSKQIIISLICCVASFSTSFAQEKKTYESGNTIQITPSCDETGPVPPLQQPEVTPYTGGNRAPIAQACMGSMFQSFEQIRSACYGASGALFTVEMVGTPGTYSFWWPSLSGDKNDPQTWSVKVTNPAGTFNLPLGATLESPVTVGLQATDEWIYVYSSELNQVDSLPTRMDVFEQFNPGSFTVSSAPLCYGSSTITIEPGNPSGGDGSYTYEWYGNGNKIEGATSATYSPSSVYTSVAGPHTFTRWVKDNSGCTNYEQTGGSFVLTVGAELSPGSFSPAAGAICYDAATTITPVPVAGGGGGYTYTWYVRERDGSGWTPRDTVDGDYSAENYVLTTTYTQNPGAYLFTRHVKDACDNEGEIQTWYNLTVYPPFLPTTEGSSITTGSEVICNGGGETIALSAPGAVGGDGSYTYEWRVSIGEAAATAVANATNAASYTPGIAYRGVQGTYTFTRWVKDGSSCAEFVQTPGAYVLYVEPPVSPGTINEGNETVCVGGTPLQTIESKTPAVGGGEISYQWYWNGKEIEGATAESYTPVREQTLTAGTVTYTRKAKSSFCGNDLRLSGGTYELIVEAGIPINVTPPVDSILYNSTVGVTLTADDKTPCEYTWQVSTDGGVSWTIIPGATAATYITEAPLAVNSYYRAMATATNGCVFGYGQEAVVNVLGKLNPGGITDDVATICEGSSLPTVLTSTTPAKGGSGKYLYTWKVTKDGNTTTASTSTTSGDYAPANIHSGQVGVYTFNRWVKDTETGEEFQSTGAFMLTVVAKPALTINSSASTTLCYGSVATFSVEDLPSTTYTWEQSTGNDGVWRKVGGNSHTLTSGALSATTTFRVKAQQPHNCESAFVAAEVEVYEEFNPGAVENTTLLICNGAEITTIISATPATGGDGEYEYLWHKDGNPIDVFGDGETQQEFALSNYGATATTALAGTYTRKAVDGTCNTTPADASDQYIVKVLSADEMKVQKIDVTPTFVETYAGASVTFMATKIAGAKYNWEYGRNGTDFINWTSTEQSTLTETIKNNPSYFRATVSLATCDGAYNLNMKDYGTVAKVVFPAVSFTAGSITAGEQILCEGGAMNTITGTVPSGGKGSYTYQWQVNGEDISGATTPDFIPVAGYTFETGTYNFTRVVTDGTGQRLVSTGVYTLKVVVRPTVINITSSSAGSLCFGDNSGMLTADVVPGATYAWEESINVGTANEKWLMIPGANAATYNFNDITRKTGYRVKVSQATACEVTSRPVIVNVDDEWNGGAIESTTYLACLGSDRQTIGSLQPATGGSGNFSYQWFRNDETTPIPGANAATYTPGVEAFAPVGTSTTYTRKAVDAVCSKPALSTGTYVVKVVTKEGLPSTVGRDLSLTATPNPVYAGDKVHLVTHNIAGATYTWENMLAMTDPILPDTVFAVDATVTELSIFEVTATVTNGCGYNNTVLHSRPVIVNILNELKGGSITESGATVCAGNGSDITVPATGATGGDGRYTYHWSVDGVPESTTTHPLTTYRVPEKYYYTPGTYEITRTVTDQSGGATTTEGAYILTVVAKPVLDELTITSSTPVCYDGTVDLSVKTPLDGATTYTWKQLEGNFFNEMGTTTVPNFTSKKLTKATTFSVEAKQPNCTSNSDPVTVMVSVFNKLDSGAIENTTLYICAGASVTPTIQSVRAASGGDPGEGYEYEWYRGSTLVRERSADATYTPSGSNITGTYTRKVYNESCAKEAGVWSEGSYIIKPVTAEEIADLKINIEPNKVQVSIDSTVELAATNIAGAKYTWEKSVTGITNFDPDDVVGNNYRMTTEQIKGTTWYRVKATIPANLCGATEGITLESSNTATITLYEEFKAGAITPGAITVCEDATSIGTILGGQDPTGGDLQYVYEWQVNMNGETLVAAENASSSLAIIRTYLNKGAGEYVFTRWVTSLGKTLKSDGEYKVTVIAKPGDVSITPGDSVLCYNGTVNLTATAMDGVDYTWQRQAANGEWRTAPDAANSHKYTTGANSVTSAYRVTVVNKNGYCSQVISAVRTYTVLPELKGGAIDNTTFTVCAGGETDVIGSVADATGGSGDIQYVWTRTKSDGSSSTFSPDGGRSSTYQVPLSDVNVADTLTYTREVRDRNCGTVYSTGTYTIIVVGSDTERPSLTVKATPPKAHKNTQVTLEATNVGGATYKWFVNGSTDPVPNVASYKYTAMVTAASTYKVEATIKGCGASPATTTSASVTVDLYADVEPGRIPTGTYTVCVDGEAPVIMNGTAASGGDGNYIYRWTMDNEIVQESASPNYTVAGNYIKDAGVYTITREVRDNSGSSWKLSDGVYTLQVVEAPVLGPITGGAAIICSGEPAGVLSVNLENTGYGATTYTWEQAVGGAWIKVGNNSSSFTPGNLSETANYRVKAEQPYCAASEYKTLTINVRAPFNAGTVENTTLQACVGTDVPAINSTPASGAGGASDYRYKWMRDGFPIDATLGGENETFDPSKYGTAAAAAGTYTREVTSIVCGSTLTSSGTYVIKALTPPEIAVLNINITPAAVQTTQDATVKLEATNVADAQYTWETRTDGTEWTAADPDTELDPEDIGGTNYIYVTKVTAAPVYYRASAAVTSSGECSTTVNMPSTSAATITFMEEFKPGTIAGGASTVCVGSGVTVDGATAPTGGDNNYKYQWQIDGKNISGATHTNLTISALTEAGSYTITRLVTDGAGNSATSDNTYEVTVLAAPAVSITASAASRTLCYGGDAGTLTANSSIAEVTYTWKKNDGTNWIPVGGSDAAFTPGTLNITTAYRVEVTRIDGYCTTAISSPVTFTVYDEVDGGEIETTEYVACPGSPAQTIGSVRNATGGEGNFTYQWFRNGETTPIEDATAATYSAKVPESGTVTYTRKAVDACGPVDSKGTYTISAVADVDITDITITPSTVTVYPGSTVLLQASNVNGATYNWFRRLIPATGEFEQIPGAVTFNYTATVNAASEFKVEAVISKCDGEYLSSSSVTATVNVYPALDAGTINGGESATTYVCVNGAAPEVSQTDASGSDGDLTYRWKVNGTVVSNTTGNYTVANEYMGVAGTYTITREVKDGAGNSLTSAGTYVLVVVEQPKVVINTTAAATECKGAAITLSAVVTGGRPGEITYAWTGTGGVSGTGSSLTISLPEGGGTYQVDVNDNDAVCSLSSASITIKAYPALDPGSVTEKSVIMCAGATPEPIAVTAATGGNGVYTYAWYKNTSRIANSNVAAYTPPASDAAKEGAAHTYTRVVTDGCGNPVASPGSYVLSVIAQPSATINMDPTMIVAGATTTVTATPANAGSYTYTWLHNNAAVTGGTPAGASYSGTNTDQLTISDISTPGTYDYKVRITSDMMGCRIFESAAQTLTVVPVPVVTVDRETLGVQNGTAGTVTAVTTNNTGNISYKWQYSAGGSDDPAEWSWSPVADGTPANVTYISTSPDNVTGELRITSAVADVVTAYYRAVAEDATLSSYGTFTHAAPVAVTIEPTVRGGYVQSTSGAKAIGVCINNTAVDLELLANVGSGGVPRWEYSTDNGTNWTAIVNKGSSYTTPSTLTVGTWLFRAIVAGATSFTSDVGSDAATITVNKPSDAGTIEPAGLLSICAGEPGEVSVKTTVGDLQWQYAHVGSVDYSDLNGATGTTVKLGELLATGTYTVRVQATNGSCDVAYSKVELKVVVRPKVTNITLSGEPGAPICAGAELVLKLVAGGEQPLNADQTTWLRSGDGTSWTEDVDGNKAGDNQFRVNTTTAGTYWYKASYKDACGTTTVESNLVSATYTSSSSADAGTLTLQPGASSELCKDATTILEYAKGGIDHWTWWRMKQGSTAAGSWEKIEEQDDQTSYTVSQNSTAAGEYFYQVRIDKLGGSCSDVGYTSEQKITIRPELYVNLNSLGDLETTVCHGYFVDLVLSGSGTTFKWTKTVNGETPDYGASGEGLINQELKYTGNETDPDTVVYRITPVMGNCEGPAVEKKYILYPSLTINLDKEESNLTLSCYNGDNGIIKVTTVPGGMNYTYTLSGTAAQSNNTGVFTGLKAGSYTIRAENTAGCAAVTSATITQPESAVEISGSTATPVTCYGESNGSIQLEITGGEAPYLVSMNGGAASTATSFNGLPAGMYAFVVTDKNSCSAQRMVPVLQPDKLDISVISITGVSASGASDAKAVLKAQGGRPGTPPAYKYALVNMANDYSTSNTVVGLHEGTNYVYAKDSVNCTVQLPIEIGTYDPVIPVEKVLSATASVTRALTCAGAADAQVTVSILGGKGRYSYSLNGMSFPQLTEGVNKVVIKDLAEGEHTITIQDEAEKTVVVTVSVQPAAPLSLMLVSVTQADDDGQNGAVRLQANGGSGNYEYSYSLAPTTWENNALFSPLSTGSYSFVARDGKCMSPAVIVNIQAAAVTPVVLTATVTKEVTCAGEMNGEIILGAYGGTPPYKYAIADGTPAENAVFTGLAAGDHIVKVVDTRNESASMTVTIKAPAGAPVIDMGNTVIEGTTCGLNNAMITVKAAGSGTLQYSADGVKWSASPVLTNLPAGNRNVYVKDQYGCKVSQSMDVPAGQPLTLTVDGLKTASEKGAANGELRVSAAGGKDPYTFTLTRDDGSTNPVTKQHASTATITFDGLKAGNYTISVKDQTDCGTANQKAVIGDGPSQPDGLSQLSGFYTTKDLSCAGVPTGEIHVTVNGGKTPYTYSLDGSSFGTSSTFTGLAAGTYTVYVRDGAENAMVMKNIIINGPKPLTVTATVLKDVSAIGATDAQVQVTATGGTVPYNYSFNGSAANTKGLFTTGAGEYTVMVSDKAGCSVEGRVKVNGLELVDPEDPTGPVITVPSIAASVVSHPTCAGAQNGVISVTATGAERPYSFSIDKTNWYSNTITGVPAGTFKVYLKELGSGKETEGPSVTLIAPAALTLTVDITAITAKAAADGTITLHVAGGTKPYQYSIDGGSHYQMDSLFTGLPANLYNLTAKDQNGCAVVSTAKLAEGSDATNPNEPVGISFTVEEIRPVSCFGVADGQVVLKVTGAGTYEYSSDMNKQNWKSDSTLTGISAGAHWVYVRSILSGGATIQDSVNVVVGGPAALVATARVLQQPSDNYTADGIVEIHVIGGSGNYSYSINDRPAIPAVSRLDGLAKGSYTITVRDLSGCGTVNIALNLTTVGLVSNTAQITLLKGGTSEVYALRLTGTAPTGNVTVSVTGSNLVSIYPAELTFTAKNWDSLQPVTVSANTGTQIQNVVNTVIKNTVTTTDDIRFSGLATDVLVTIKGDATKDCNIFKDNKVVFSMNGVSAGDASEITICSSNAPYALSAAVIPAGGSSEDMVQGLTYRFWRNGIGMRLTSGRPDEVEVTQGGTYEVEASNGQCRISAAITVKWEDELAEPVIIGNKTSKPGAEQEYTVLDDIPGVQYNWTLPYEYTQRTTSSTYIENTRDITINTGNVSASLKLEAVAVDHNVCGPVATSFRIEIVTTPEISLYPTVVKGDEMITLVPKDMIISGYSVTNTIGVRYDNIVRSRTAKTAQPGEQVQISLGGVPGGHYFIYIYGTDSKGNEAVVVKQVVKD